MHEIFKSRSKECEKLKKGFKNKFKKTIEYCYNTITIRFSTYSNETEQSIFLNMPLSYAFLTDNNIKFGIIDLFYIKTTVKILLLMSRLFILLLTKLVKQYNPRIIISSLKY